MKSAKIVLDKVCINNFLSLHKVELPLKPLTILVGPNASGKSNVIQALEFLQRLIFYDQLPSVEVIKNYMWAGGADKISLKIDSQLDNKHASYSVEIQPKSESRFFREELIIESVKVISVQKGSGEVKDEDGKNPVAFHSTKLALRSAGDYGDKPITAALTKFVQSWSFYDFSPEIMREDDLGYAITMKGSSKMLTSLDTNGQLLRYLLSDWNKEYFEGFKAVNDGLEDYTGFTIELGTDEENEIQLREGYKNLIPLEGASDGTLRLLAYHVLLNEPNIASLIVIEEPERNLHPAMLHKIGNLLERLAQRTQVIITTHSSQLLDSFNTNQLADKLGVLLLRNKPGSGTEVINLAEAQEDSEALRGWIEDFGIGSAIFHSELLQDVMES